MAVSLYQISIDAHDLPSQARFWCRALDWRILHEAEDEIVIGAHVDAVPGIVFVPVPEGKTLKNRLHLDLNPPEGEQESEVERLLGLGAMRLDIGQGADVSWTVLSDPEGNEFCVLSPKKNLVE